MKITNDGRLEMSVEEQKSIMIRKEELSKRAEEYIEAHPGPIIIGDDPMLFYKVADLLLRKKLPDVNTIIVEILRRPPSSYHMLRGIISASSGGRYFFRKIDMDAVSFDEIDQITNGITRQYLKYVQAASHDPDVQSP